MRPILDVNICHPTVLTTMDWKHIKFGYFSLFEA